MQRLILMTVTLLLVSSPVLAKDDAPDCEDKKKVTASIYYGDSLIDVVPKVRVDRDNCIVLKLYPQKRSNTHSDPEYWQIELIGKTDDAQWLNKKIKASETNHKRFNIHVPANLDLGTYAYAVVVPDVGRLDPLVIVEN